MAGRFPNGSVDEAQPPQTGLVVPTTSFDELRNSFFAKGRSEATRTQDLGMARPPVAEYEKGE
jgi:hypothetical protein